MKVILKVTNILLTDNQLCLFRKTVIEQLNTDGIAIVPAWCDVFILYDEEGETICQ